MQNLGGKQSYYGEFENRELSIVPRSGYITARDQIVVESGVTKGGKNTASFHFRE